MSKFAANSHNPTRFFTPKHQFFRYSNKDKRTPLYEAMNLLFPQLYQLACGIWHEESEESVVLQKQILKIFFSFTQVNSKLLLIS